jgi:histidinol-phosphate aminotransferase
VGDYRRAVPLRPALSHVRPYRPQRPLRELQAQLGLGRMVKLASNEGAFGPLPGAVAAFEAAVGELNRYPDGGGLRLREALAERHGVAPEQVVPGNGADELIRLCAVSTLDARDRAVLPWPSFPSYVAAAACCGAEAVRVPLRGRTLDLDALLAAGKRPGTKLAYLATPNNPTGTLPTRAALRRLLDELPNEVVCVLDEAYAEYADPEPDGIRLVAEGRERLCVLRTFSKVYGLAALRIGYAVASPDVADALDRVRPIFNVNQPAQEAALASLHEPDAVAGRVAHARRGRERLLAAMRAAGLEPEPSQANFVYAEVPGGEGAELANALLSEGVIVRALAGFGAPGAIRVTAGTDEENELFAGALARVMAQSGARPESSRL